jgi:Peptidase family M23
VRRHRTTARGIAFLLLAAAALASVAVAATPSRGLVNGRPIVFPLVGKALLTGSWGDPRPNGRHAGEDIMVARRSPVLAAEAGRIKWWRTSILAGCMLYLYGESRTTYLYIHLNNDAGTGNDNKGGCEAGTTYTVDNGARVQAGEQIAWSGDSGDAAGNPHLHFEVHPDNGADVDPLSYLKAAVRHLFPARAGQQVTVGLRGTLAGAGDGLLQLRATGVRWWPNGRWTELDPRTVTIAVPDEAVMDGDLLKAVRGLPERFPAGRDATALTVFTTPAAATGAMLRGEPGALVAARISKR